MGLAPACDSLPFGISKSCATSGCIDQFSATVSVNGNTLATGTHTITVTTDGKTDVCTFTFPLQTLPGGGFASPQCTGNVQMIVVPAKICTETQTATTRTLTCDPVADRFQEIITVSGVPKAVHAQQSVGGNVILDQSVSPKYKTSQPNGPDCDPTCHQAAVMWTIP